MKRFLLILLLAVVAIPVLAIDENYLYERLRREAKLYGAEVLGEDWKAFQLVQQYSQVNIAWLNEELQAVITVERIVFFSDRAKESYFGEDMQNYFDIAFSYYSPYELDAECESDELILHEFTGEFASQDYLIKHYYLEFSERDIRTLIFYFPSQYAEELESTAALFFPDFLSCSEA
jgi:hypothetical protein